MGSCLATCNETSKLKKANLKTTPKLSFDGLCAKAVLLDAYDGDTCDLALFRNDELVQIRCRLAGIDTPEIKSEHKDKAIRARNKLISCACNCDFTLTNDAKRPDVQAFINENKKIITAHCGKFDKYGRVLVTLFDKDININKTLLDLGFAKPYDGGKKEN